MNSVDNLKMRRFETKGNCSLLASATQEELLVYEILLGLENLMPLPIFNWGLKKRRCCLDAAPFAPPSLQIAEEDIEVRRSLVETEEEDASTATTTTPSPATPLCFSPDESGGMSKLSSKNNYKKRPMAQCIDTIEELTDHGDLLREEMKNERKQYNELKSQGSDLKAIKQEGLKTRQRVEEPRRDMGIILNLGMDFIQQDGKIMVPHRQPFVADQTAHKIHNPFEPSRTQVYPPNVLESVISVGPYGIPDLKLTAEEAFGVDSTQPRDVDREVADRRARFAEARRMKKGMIMVKSTRSAYAIILPRR